MSHRDFMERCYIHLDMDTRREIGEPYVKKQRGRERADLKNEGK